MNFTNKYKFSELKEGMVVVLKYDIVYLEHISRRGNFGQNSNENENSDQNSNENENSDQNSDENENLDQVFDENENFEQNFDQNLFRGQVGIIDRVKKEMASETGLDNVTYLVAFEDKEQDADFFDNWINEIEVSSDKLLPLLLPCSYSQNIEDHFRDCYLQKMYTEKYNLENPPIFECEQNEAIGLEFETVANPDLPLQFEHDKTSNQFDPGSLITFAGVCRSIENFNHYVYPGQIELIINQGTSDSYQDMHYVQVLLFPADLYVWANYSTQVSQDNSSATIRSILKKHKQSFVININKYNLIPVFHIKLKIESEKQLPTVKEFPNPLKI